MDGTLEVTTGTLHTCAERDKAIGKAASAMPGRTADACAQAAGPHPDWAFAAALPALASRWRQESARQGAAVAGDAAKLADTASTYADAEASNTNLARSLHVNRAV